LPYYTTIQISPLLPCEDVGSEEDIVIFGIVAVIAATPELTVAELPLNVTPVKVPAFFVKPHPLTVDSVGIVGVPIKSEYVPVFAILCKFIAPLKASEEAAA
jgi:hypothetical protein